MKNTTCSVCGLSLKKGPGNAGKEKRFCSQKCWGVLQREQSFFPHVAGKHARKRPIAARVGMAASLYPALLASRLARPSKVTGFTFPPVAGDEVRLELPFSFNARDAQAITAFLAEYFDAHAEASAGEFSSGNIALGEVRDGRKTAWQLSARVWLAPYDFGVSQDMVFRTREGIGDESSADLVITRQSGDQASWRRVNQRFMKSIRKQFLIWRALGEAARANYLRRARQAAAKGAANAQA